MQRSLAALRMTALFFVPYLRGEAWGTLAAVGVGANLAHFRIQTIFTPAAPPQ
jgi:hypothetical protein